MAQKGVSILLLFVSVLSGCSGYKIAVIPSGPEFEEQAESDQPILKEKMQARVYLKSGEVHIGEVVQISDSEVTIGRTGNYGFEETAFRLDEIEKVEVPAGSKVASVIVSTTGIVVFSLSALVILFMVSGGVGNLD